MRRHSPLLDIAMVPITVALLVLVGLALLGFRGTLSDRPGVAVIGPASDAHPAADQTRQFFNWPSRVQWLPLTNSSNPFFTLAIQPPPPPKPPPPPPATRKVDITYRGFLETSAGVRRAVVQIAETQALSRLGDKVVSDFVAAGIELRFLLLTNAAGQTNVFEFTKTKPLEIPAK